MFCHQCGAAIDDPDDRFCSHCGVPLRRGEGAGIVAPGPQSPLAEPPADRHRRPISTWPDGRRERIQLPLTELRQRRVRGTAETPPAPSAMAAAPAEAGPAPTAAPDATGPPGAADLEVVALEAASEEDSVPSRAEAALHRMVPPKDAWADENRPGPAERVRVRDEWPGPVAADRETAAPAAVFPAPIKDGSPPPAPEADDAIIPWLEPPIVPVRPERPVPPSQEKSDEGPIIVPRDYDENAARQRKGRRRSPRPRGPLYDPAALGRSIKPSWILAIAGVILLTLIVFAIFPPGGRGDGSGSDEVNRFTGIPIHTVSTPARPTAGTPAITPAPTNGPDGVSTATAEPALPGLVPPAFGVQTGTVAVTTAITTTVATTTQAAAGAGATGIRVVISAAGGWSGTIGQQSETYTETAVVGSGTQIREITGPATMVTANIQKLDQTAGLLEVRVERDGVLLKRGSTTEPAGIVALSVVV